jgi:hypothetical protein
LIVDSADTGGDRGKYLVGYGVGSAGYLLQQFGITEDGHFVTLLARNVCDIQKTHIHADAADDGYLHAMQQHTSVAIAEVAVETVGITDRDDGDS